MPAPRRHLLPACALAAAVTASLLLPAGPAAAGAASYGSTAVRATNVQRADHHLRGLREQRCLQRKAVRQAKRMAAQESMFHQDLGPVLRDCGMSHVGENVAMGFDSGTAVVKAWMQSPEHRANILDGDYGRIGLAARQGADGLWYVSQVFGHRA